MKKNISSKPQSRNAPDRYLYFDLPGPPSLSEIWSLWSASRPTIARPTSEHLTPLQHSNTATLANLVLWSVGTWQPRPYILLEDAAGQEAKCQSHCEDFTYTFYMDKTRYKIKVKGFLSVKMLWLKIADWCENLLRYWSLVLGPAWAASIIKCGEPI